MLSFTCFLRFIRRKSRAIIPNSCKSAQKVVGIFSEEGEGEKEAREYRLRGEGLSLTGEASYVSCLTFKDLQASRHIFKKAGKPTLISVPVHPGNAMKTGTHRAFLKESGIKSGE